MTGIEKRCLLTALRQRCPGSPAVQVRLPGRLLKRPLSGHFHMSNAKFLISLQTLSPGPCWGALEHTVRRESGRGGISACRDLSCVPSAALAAHHHTQHSARMWVFTWNRQMWGLASLSKCPQATQLGAYTGGEAGGREQRFSTGHLVTVGPNTQPKCVRSTLENPPVQGRAGT